MSFSKFNCQIQKSTQEILKKGFNDVFYKKKKKRKRKTSSPFHLVNLRHHSKTKSLL